MTDSQQQAYNGQRGLTDNSSEFNNLIFLIEQVLGRVSTMKLVRVMKVNGGGGAVAKIGTVDVVPVTAQTDGTGKATPHGVIHGVAYHRHQGGNSGTILDPVVGDIGLMHVADRDVSASKQNYVDDKPIPANPGSFRRFDLADGVYLGGALNKPPEQYHRYHGGSDGKYDSHTVNIVKQHTVNVVKGNIKHVANQDPDNKSTTGSLEHTADGGNIMHTAKKKNNEGGKTTHASDVSHTINTASHVVNASDDHTINASKHDVNAITNISKLLKTVSIAKLTNYIH